MKKKLEAELISIAHRILKLKNRAELDQLQQETLRLYEKISVLRFVEDNFNDVKPTIGYASAEEKLEEIYGIEETAPVHANEQEAKEEQKPKTKSQKPQGEQPKATSQKPQAEEGQDKENDKGEGVTAGSSAEEVVSEEEKEQTAKAEEAQATGQQPQDDKSEEGREPITDNQEQEEIAEGGPASEEEKRYTEEETDEKAVEREVEEPQGTSQKPKAVEGSQTTQPTTQNPEPETRNPEPAQPAKQKEITFEDFHDYKEPEFVKKEDVKEPQSINIEFLPKEPEVIQKQEENAAALSEEPQATSQQPQEETQPTQVRDWRDWEPSTSPYGSKKEEPKAEEPQAISQKAQETQPATTNPQPGQSATGRVITLGLNDRIAFEKHLFGGSGEDLNRVISQLNTFNTFQDAKDFINDLVKPDYNNWKGKEEYEERLFQLVENRFS